ncbi:hypothetical protein B0A49_04808 [Cryomyces minteri]|uniref:CSC1/OSCA1-like 7TM region domain-containing protein n=1 Tax=Cryomyces minteri TaxID=331657 RepID=A0A4U0X4V8_9PEZI|nr:hypothetical protein B0A49_04808 [Cryomyces minteri]
MASLMHATVKEASKLVARQASQSNDPNIGSAQKGSNSVSTVVSTLVPVLLFALVWFALFLILRSKLPRNYRPRTFLGSLRQNERSPSLPTGLFNWFGAFFSLPDTYVLNHHSLDGFLFLRLLKISVVTCFVGCLITWPVLFPVNATGGGGQTQFDLLTMGNVTNSYYRYFAHAGCAYLFFGFVMFMITRESIFFINLRQAYLMSPYYSSRLSSRTVLFTSVPADYMNETKLRRMLGSSVRRIWIVSDVKDLEDLVEERDKVAMKLEAAETKLIKLANVARVKEEKKGGARHDSGEAVIGPNAASGSMAARYIKPKQRPTHRLKPLIGKKVDTIDWSRNELQKLIPKVDKLQAEHRAGDAKYLNSVFVEFETLSDAQAAYQSLTHHQVLHMAPRYTGISPEEVIWKNLRIKWWERVIRVIVTTSFVVALIIFWSIPVAVVASISNINALIGLLPWLSFLNKIPSVILGVVTGLLPTILLAVLMALLPIVLRLSAKLGGDPSLSAVELTVQNSYFGFQVVQVFLVATLGSAASASVNTIISNPTSVTTLLAQQIPKASNFYLAYFVLQGLGVVSSLLVGLVGLIVFFVLGKLLDKTPRKMYKRWVQLSGVGWGTVFPIYTNLFVIAICYACIAPLVLAFAAIGLWFFYFAYRYNLLFVSNANIDTKGLVYPRALQQLFVGLYVAELCLIGLFAIKAGTPGAIGPLILMIVLLVFTALYHISLNAAIDPLMKYLPKSLDAEERRLLDIENGGETGTLVDDESGYRKEHLGVQNARTHGADAEGLGPAPHKKPNFLTKFLRPDVYTDYATMRRLVPKDVVVQYEPEIERDAYFNPAIKSRTPLLWIPRDAAGVSRQEVNDTSKVIPITDEGAFFDEKNRITWDAEGGRPPIWEPKVYY